MKRGYINRLQDFTDKGCPNLKLATSDIRVRFAGKSGGNASSMQRELTYRRPLFINLRLFSCT